MYVDITVQDWTLLLQYQRSRLHKIRKQSLDCTHICCVFSRATVIVGEFTKFFAITVQKWNMRNNKRHTISTNFTQAHFRRWLWPRIPGTRKERSLGAKTARRRECLYDDSGLSLDIDRVLFRLGFFRYLSRLIRHHHHHRHHHLTLLQSSSSSSKSNYLLAPLPEFSTSFFYCLYTTHLYQEINGEVKSCWYV